MDYSSEYDPTETTLIILRWPKLASDPLLPVEGFSPRNQEVLPRLLSAIEIQGRWLEDRHPESGSCSPLPRRKLISIRCFEALNAIR